MVISVKSESATMPLQEEPRKFNLDLLIHQIGPFGRFQLWIFILICIPVVFTAMYTMVFVFTAGEVYYRCRIPECEAKNAAFSADFLNFTIPSFEGNFARCKRFQGLPNIGWEDQCQGEFFDTNQTEECSELIYQDDETTMQNEWNLGCSEEWKLSLVGTVNKSGQFLGLLLIGYFSDRYGRRTAFIWSIFLSATLGIIRSFSVNFTMLLIFEFIEPVASSGIYSVGFILGMELIGPERRALGSFILSIAFTLSLMLLGFEALLTKEWRLLTRVAFAPSFLIITYRWLIPESTRWLVNKNRVEEAARIIDLAAKYNESLLTVEAKSMLRQAIKGDPLVGLTDENNEKKVGGYRLMSAFKSCTLMLRIVNCSFAWAALAFVYAGLTMYSVSLAGDKYINFILNCFIEIPGAFICYLLMDRIGRRKLMSLSLLVTGISCIAYILLTDVSVNAQIAATLIGKSTVTMSFITIYVYVAELFPTELRQTLLSTCAIFGRAGAIMAPFTIFLGKYMESMEMILFASMTIPAGIFILFAPETLNQPLPDTIQEAENIGKKFYK